MSFLVTRLSSRAAAGNINSRLILHERRGGWRCKDALIRVCCFMTTTTTTTTAALAAEVHSPSTARTYDPPSWTREILTRPPQHGRLSLANLPTPLYQLFPSPSSSSCSSSSSSIRRRQEDVWALLLPSEHEKFRLFIKRDDCTGGVELGGNKVRKLEFLLADALATNCDSVITIGGLQSNHCRATAAAARMLGLESHLILRTKEQDDLGLIGNVLLDRLLASGIYTCTPGEYGRVGSEALVQRLAEHLRLNEHKYPYPIGVGGSNGLGSWGYIEAVQELLLQWNSILPDDDDDDNNNHRSLDHVVVACGSGGTVAGICLGLALAHRQRRLCRENSNSIEKQPMVHAIGVCDDPDYFYNYVAKIADQMGFFMPKEEDEGDESTKMTTTEDFIRRHMVVHQGKGLGYAISTPEELQFVANFARATGIVLDPVYSGKALYQFFTQVVHDNPEDYANANVLFWHTGGALGLYDKVESLGSVLSSSPSAFQRLDVYGKGNGGLPLPELSPDATK